MAEDFTQNRMAPIEPVNFGIQDAIAKAYQYLLEKDRQLKAPARIAAGGIKTGAGLIQDKLANMAASVFGAQRVDPDAAATSALKDATPAAQDLASAGQSLSDVMSKGRRSLVDAMGWKDIAANATTAAPAIVAPAPVSAPVDQPARPGALPPARRPVVRSPGGALPTEPVVAQTPETPGNGDLYAPQAGAERTAGGGIIPTVPRPAEAQAKSLRDKYLERMAGMAKPGAASMTDEQKGQALLEAGLAIMAAGSRPGSSALGAIGQGGQAGTAVAREMARINRERADKMRAEGRADVRTEFDLAGKDEDRANRKEDKAEANRIRELDITERAADRKENAAINSRKIDLLEEQVRQGKVRIEKGDGVFVAFDLKNPGQGTIVTDASGKPISTKPKGESEDAIVKRIKAIAQLTGKDVKDVASSMLGDKSAEAANEMDTNKILRRFPAEYLKGGMNPPDELPARLQALANALSGVNNGTSGTPPKISTKAEFDALSKGTEYIGPDGRRARK